MMYRERGFTLMELVVVIAILAMAALLVLPRFSFSDEARLATSARTMAALLRYLGGQGAALGTGYRLHLNLAENRVTVAKRGASGFEETPDDAFLTRPVLGSGVTLTDVQLQRLGKVTEGEVTVDFGPGGLGEYLVVHLKGGERFYTLFAYPQGGRVKVVAGYREDDA